MGAGKTTIGRMLAAEFKLPFYDSDRVIEEKCGADIPWIFDVEGEAGFRDREQNVIDELSQLPNIVMATGGGAILREENRKHLASRGTVIYLRATVEHQLRRTSNDRNRPLLQTENPERVLRSLFETRDPLYQEIADVTIETGTRNSRWVMSELKRHITL